MPTCSTWQNLDRLWGIPTGIILIWSNWNGKVSYCGWDCSLGRDPGLGKMEKVRKLNKPALIHPSLFLTDAMGLTTSSLVTVTFLAMMDCDIELSSEINLFLLELLLLNYFITAKGKRLRVQENERKLGLRSRGRQAVQQRAVGFKFGSSKAGKRYHVAHYNRFPLCPCSLSLARQRTLYILIGICAYLWARFSWFTGSSPWGVSYLSKTFFVNVFLVPGLTTSCRGYPTVEEDLFSPFSCFLF